MTREELIDKICPECNRNGCDDQRCEDCNELLNKWLDEYEKEIISKAYDDAFEIVLNEQHQITTFSDKVGIKILRRKKELLEGE